MIPPGSWLGLLGGGQLGRMFTHAAQSMGYKVLVLDPDPLSPAGAVAERHLQAGYTEPKALAEIAGVCAAVTTEFENVPADSLEYLGRTIPARPGAPAVRIAQDRVAEKTFFSDNGFAVAPFRAILGEADCRGLPGDLLPGIVKTARLGYDAKGQVVVGSEAEVLAAFRKLGGQPCVLERRVALACEISVLIARSPRGQCAVWPVAENAHRDGILDLTLIPARIPDALAERARAMGESIATRLGYIGVLCVEMFVTGEGALLVNEMAPRPHNSGHWTIDAAVTSQFEQQCRAMTDAPLGDTTAHSGAAMLNLLGDIWFDPASPASSAAPRDPDWQSVLEDPTAKLHLYGKHEPRRGRKMGHVTCIGGTVESRLASIARIRQALGIPGS
jgi:5-(carboxyamino)imidazole ribonucleotide synthase